MGYYVADQNQVVWFFESGTYGSKLNSGSLVSGNWVGLVQSHDPTDSENIQEVRYTGTASRNVGQFVDGPRDHEGTISYFVQDFNMAMFAFGSNVDSGSPSPYIHTISELNSDGSYAFTSGTLNPFPSFTVVDSKKATEDGQQQVREYNGCIIDSFNLAASEGEPITCEVGYKAQSLTLGSKTADIPSIRNEDTSRPFLWSDVQLHIVSGTKVDVLKDVSFTLSNNLESKHYVNGSRVAAIQVPTNRDYEVTATLDADSTWGKILYEQYWLGGSTFNSILNFTILAGSEEANLIMSGCRITDFSAPTPNEGIDEYSLTYKPKTANMVVDDYVFKYNID